MTVLYRKYRPGKIAEIDSQAVREKLEIILSSGAAPHAFLFAGPKGSGKTSAARIIAKSINCEKNNGRGEPCNKCPTCLSITNGINLDVLEIDAASNRGIDEIRDLREKIKLAPASARKKVYVIDEAHMLTTEAFNALLKTLEEPPPHALFVLCTTVPEKLPETIISRCTRLDFKRANTDDLIRSLKRAKKGEKREIEEEALLGIASRSEGSYRDAHKLLELVLLTYPRAKINVEMVKKVLGEKEVSEDVFEWIIARDAKIGLKMVNTMVEKGVDFKFLTQMILDTLHNHLLANYGIIKENFDYNKKFTSLTLADLQKLISLISQASRELRTSPIPQLPLELAIVEWCEGEDEIGAGGNEFFQPASQPSAQDPGHSTRANLSGDIAVRRVSKIAARHPCTGGLGEIENRWEEILAAVKPQNHSVAGLLRSCRPISFDGKNLAIEAFYKFHFERLSEPKVKDLLEKVLQNLFAKKIKISPALSGEKGGK
ncbi:MAG: DNA polymerase III subunit gamma/tau [Microgenomates group bacterium LiPW_16]|nr:MAG: DNA polymerase III subunit gamma/tau [Microgenomates group bacterium LiPW_16]